MDLDSWEDQKKYSLHFVENAIFLEYMWGKKHSHFDKIDGVWYIIRTYSKISIKKYFWELGLRVGGRVNRIENWSKVMEKIRRRLRRWDVRNLSMRGAKLPSSNRFYRVSLYTAYRSRRCQRMWLISLNLCNVNSFGVEMSRRRR